MSSPPLFSLQRTNEDFTTGIVNTPVDTPAIVYFIVRSKEDRFKAQEALTFYKAPHHVEVKKKGDIVITDGPISRDYINNLKAKFANEPSLQIKTKVVDRYLFFELDSKDPQMLETVLNVYRANKIPVYYHETMRGYHFLSVKPIPEATYHFLLASLKPLNMACPHVTLRIKPNKWVGEREIFKRGNTWESPELEDIPHNQRVRQLARWIELQHIGLIKKYYFVVHYRQTGELANL